MLDFEFCRRKEAESQLFDLTLCLTQNAGSVDDDGSQGSSQQDVGDDYARQSSASLPTERSNGTCVQRALQ